MDLRDVALVGPSNSGKDTIADYLKTNFGYRKMRIIGPVKHLLVSKYGMSHEQFDNFKRSEPGIFSQHRELIMNMLPSIASLKRRCEDIVKRVAPEFEMFTNKERHIVICDVRGQDDCVALLNMGVTCVFLTRNSDGMVSDFDFFRKYKKSVFSLKYTAPINELEKLFPNKIIIVNNGLIDLGHVDVPTERIASFMDAPNGIELTSGIVDILTNNLINHE